MARIVRVHQKIFGSAGDNGVVGSELASGTNSGTLSNDIAVLQSLAAYTDGLNSVTLTGENLPPQEEIQALFNIDTTQLAYLFQEGIPEYDDETTYYNTTSISIVKKPGTTELYYSKTDDNLGNALADTVNWGLLGDLANIPDSPVVAATESTAGIAEIATQGEADAGSDDARFITPLKLRFGFAASFAASGYIAFPSWLGGWIVQWGTATGSWAHNSSQSANFPIAFPTASYRVIIGSPNTADAGNCGISANTTTNFTFRVNNYTATTQTYTIQFLAIGK
ncbi:MAG: gp53-like domain-containing protein [Flavobacterium sp.]